MLQVQVQVQFIDNVAIVLMVQTVQVVQVQVVEKDGRSATATVRRQGRCCACCVAKGGAHDPHGAEVHRGVPKGIKWTRWLTLFTYDGWDARRVSGTGAEHPDDCRDIDGAIHRRVETVTAVGKIEKISEVHQLQFSYQVVDVQLSRNAECLQFRSGQHHREVFTQCCARRPWSSKWYSTLTRSAL